MWANKNPNGFTIVELLIVVAVIGILAAVSLVAYSGVQSKAKTATVNTDLKGIKTAMMTYRADFGTLPNNADWQSGTTMPPTNRWATEIIANLKNLKYIQTDGLEKNPWGSITSMTIMTVRLARGGSSSVKSVGPDGVLSTAAAVVILFGWIVTPMNF